MADFSARFTSGVTLEPWDDPASVSPDRPSRTNPQPEHIHKRHVGTVGAAVQVQATVGGVEGPNDSTLGGELFSATFLEVPSFPAPAFFGPAGFSSIRQFVPTATGHYTLQLDRANHGGLILHVDVDS